MINHVSLKNMANVGGLMTFQSVGDEDKIIVFFYSFGNDPFVHLLSSNNPVM